MSTLRISHILVPVDFSEGTALSLNYANDLAKMTNARVSLLHVRLPVMPMGSEFGVASPDLSVQLNKAAEDQLKILAERHHAQSAVVLGVPWDAIVQYAEEHAVDLIILPTHGRSGLSHLMLGSVAERVVQHAHCPVLIVRAPKPDKK
jgi:universal stress protein A